jgi:CDP-diglyceride synthetase
VILFSFSCSSFFFCLLLLLLLLLPLCGDLTESAVEEKMNSSSPRVSGKV